MTATLEEKQISIDDIVSELKKIFLAHIKPAIALIVVEVLIAVL